jgi:hypothetical protein
MAAAPLGIIGKGLRLLRRPTEGQRIIEPVTKEQRAYDKGVVKGAGTGAAAGAAGTSGIEDVMEFIAPGSSVQKEARSSDNVSSKMKNTVRDIQGTPAELAADKKRAASKTVKVSKPKPNTKASRSSDNVSSKMKNTVRDISEDSKEDIKGFLRIKKSKGGKVSMGRGMGKALRGGGKVMR